MDPSWEYCLKSEIPDVKPEIKMYSIKKTGFKAENIVYRRNDKQKLSPLYIQEDLYEEIKKLKGSLGNYPGKEYSKAREETYQFETLHDMNCYINRAAVKMMNIDWCFGLSTEIQSFCDIAGGPGGFSQYLLEKQPSVVGYGITIENTVDSLKWNRGILPRTYKVFETKEDNGDILIWYNEFITWVRKENKQGVDLVVADAGIENPDREEYQEDDNFPLIMTELLMGMKLLKVGGNLIVKVFDCFTFQTLFALYYTSCRFDNYLLFKPLSSRPANSEKYFILKGFKGLGDIKMFEVLHKRLLNREVYTKFMDIPNTFIETVIELNNTHTIKQIESINRIVAWLEGDKNTDSVYDITIPYPLWSN